MMMYKREIEKCTKLNYTLKVIIFLFLIALVHHFILLVTHHSKTY